MRSRWDARGGGALSGKPSGQAILTRRTSNAGDLERFLLSGCVADPRMGTCSPLSRGEEVSEKSKAADRARSASRSSPHILPQMRQVRRWAAPEPARDMPGWGSPQELRLRTLTAEPIVSRRSSLDAPSRAAPRISSTARAASASRRGRTPSRPSTSRHAVGQIGGDGHLPRKDATAAADAI